VPARIPAEPILVPGVGMSLRPFRPDDVDALARAYQDPELRRWNYHREFGDDWAAWVAYRMDWSDRTHASWAIADDDDAMVGSISLHHVEYEQRNGEVGYWTAAWARRRGYAQRALHLAVTFGFELVELHRIELFHAVENDASCALASKAGFRHEGTLLESFRYGDGEYHDEHAHASLAREWK
jgi:RimJ/RimL family protein N-acetyltransferase